ncbi:hypothetical protein EVAR_96448_1 [Eumeta japonica]|uniref:Uncharacterized protein n=1 Tax=Eumeta variegata TaxID=151549 RepID=A0A4C1VVZ1_EUMVA|nr:hypothetical protein EVAR_96448_1 [Eumeta japonica]
MERDKKGCQFKTWEDDLPKRWRRSARYIMEWKELGEAYVNNLTNRMVSGVFSWGLDSYTYKKPFWWCDEVTQRSPTLLSPPPRSPCFRD